MRRSTTGLVIMLGMWLSSPVLAQKAVPAALDVGRVRPAPGEVIVQVAARGILRSTPDLATFRVTLTRQGATYAMARAAVDASTRDTLARLTAAGLDPAFVRIVPGGGARMGFVGNEAYSDQEGDAAPGAAALAGMMRSRRSVSTMLEIRVVDMARLATVRSVLEGQEGVMALPPSFSLRDEAPARSAAIADAVAKARRDADGYAAALGMRVVRVVRVYDLAASASQAQDFAQVLGIMNGGDDQVVTEVRIGMEVVVGPR